MGLEQRDRALCTDLYELTMAAAYFELGMTGRAAFELTVRSLPAGRAYLVCAGLEQVVSYLCDLRFTAEQVDYLRGQDAFSKIGDEFFDYLRGFAFSGSVDAIPEGRLAFEDEPLLRVEGPIVEAQLVETFLLSMVNYQSLIATKAARVVGAAGLDGQRRLVVDFGTRRAHGPDAAVLAARAAFIGGCQGTSNVEAGHRLGIPVSGTEAHSFIMAFDSEEEAFQAYYACYGDQAILLIDTYDTVAGAQKAARIAPRMRGVRIDSGDLEELSRRVRRVLDKAGLEDAIVVASGDLDEYRVVELVRAGAPIDGFGVGTRLVVSEDAPYLGGVYKLVAVERDGEWNARLKLSEGKELYPGRKCAFRFGKPDGGPFTHDLLTAADEPCPDGAEPLMETVIQEGRPACDLPPLVRIQERAAEELSRLPERHRALQEPEPYPVEVSDHLRRKFHELSQEVESGGYG